MSIAKLKLLATILIGGVLAIEVAVFSYFGQYLTMKLAALAIAFVAFFMIFLNSYILASLFGLFLADFAIINLFGFMWHGNDTAQTISLLALNIFWILPVIWRVPRGYRLLCFSIVIFAFLQTYWTTFSWFVDPIYKALILVLPVSILLIISTEYENYQNNRCRLVLPVLLFSILLAITLWQVSKPGLY